MSKKQSARVTLTVKMLVVFLSVVLIANLVISTITYHISAKGITESVDRHLSAVAGDLAT